MEDLKACDIVFVRSEQWTSKLIRFFTRETGESETIINHVGLMVNPTAIVEALKKCERRAAVLVYGPPSKQKLAVYRPLNLTEDEKSVIIRKAEGYIGKTYGYLKLLAHALDWCFGRAYVFRRLLFLDNYPICSWLVASAFAATGKNFGIEAAAADPDDIWDFVVNNPDKYVCIHKLGEWNDQET